jgi:hypothetical protein
MLFCDEGVFELVVSMNREILYIFIGLEKFPSFRNTREIQHINGVALEIFPIFSSWEGRSVGVHEEGRRIFHLATNTPTILNPAIIYVVALTGNTGIEFLHHV